jgi:hypothetical protein
MLRDYQRHRRQTAGQGTIVGHEQIEGLLEEFGVKQQEFRDALNAFYELAPPTVNTY